MVTLRKSVQQKTAQPIIRKIVILASTTLVGLTHSANAQSVRKYSNEFLAIGVSARGVGMGNSVVASTSDVFSTYYNPTGLLSIEKDIQLGYMHSEHFAGIAKFDYGAVSYRISPNQAAALSFIRFGVDNIPNTLNLYADGVLNYDRVTMFSVADMAFFGSYAQTLPIENLQVGGNVKIIHRIAGSFAKAWGFGFDIAARYYQNHWTFAAIARDVTGTFNAWSFNTGELREVVIITGNEIPENSLEITSPRLIGAVAYNRTIFEKLNLLGEVNIDITTDKKRNTLIKSNFISIDPQMGIEIGYDKTVYARLGVHNFQKETSESGSKHFTVLPSIGIGLVINNLGVDYAYSDLGNVSGALYSHMVSLHYNLYRSKNH